MKLRDLYPNRFFLHVWRDADDEAASHRAQSKNKLAGSVKALYVLAVVAVSLTLQDYFGGPDTFFSIIGFIDSPLSEIRHPFLWSLVGWLAPDSGAPLYLELEAKGYLDLWNLCYWATWRVFGFLIVPSIAIVVFRPIMRLFSMIFWLVGKVIGAFICVLELLRPRRSSDMADTESSARGEQDRLDLSVNPFGITDLGLSLRGFSKHAWVYGVAFAPVLIAVIIVSFTEEFSTYYPFYEEAHRSLFDFGVWEAFYIAQFFALEFFFRGFMIQPLRKVMGSSAIFAMMIPYVMIHFGKPVLECFAAIIAGIVLGTLALRTRSIWAGFLIHVSVAISMDLAAIWQTHWR